MTDEERIDWIESLTKQGLCPGLVFNDNGWWAVLTEGHQSLDFADPPTERFDTSFMCESEESWRWKPTVREAIDCVHDREEEIQ